MTDTKLNTIIDSKIKLKFEEIFIQLGYLEKKNIKTLLRNYNQYKRTLEQINNNILHLENGDFEIIKITQDINIQKSLQYKSELEAKEDLMLAMKKKRDNYKYLLNLIDNMLDIIQNQKYSDIIYYRLIENKSVDEVLEHMHISLDTYKRHYKKLLESMQSIYPIFKNKE